MKKPLFTSHTKLLHKSPWSCNHTISILQSYTRSSKLFCQVGSSKNSYKTYKKSKILLPKRSLCNIDNYASVPGHVIALHNAVKLFLQTNPKSNKQVVSFRINQVQKMSFGIYFIFIILYLFIFPIQMASSINSNSNMSKQFLNPFCF